MNIETQNSTGQIFTDARAVKGIGIFIRHNPGRAPQPSCRRTMPGYTQIITGHDGSNLMIGERYGWVTNVVHLPKIREPRMVKEDDGVRVALLHPDDTVFGVRIVFETLQENVRSEMERGIWQLLDIKRYGRPQKVVLQRLLVSFKSPEPILW